MRKRMLAWYARNKRAMPWRETRDAYRVWVSEVMLQQTRVAAVLPYYLRFVKRFPTVRLLARARGEEVLRLWAGLGYYSRARNLQRAAKEIVARHGGYFPREYESALGLPGVGRYTAAAVLSMAYGEPLAVLDGNVARVLARWGAVRGDLRAAGRWQKLEAKAQELMEESGPSTSLRTSEWRVTRSEKRVGGRSIRQADSASACGSKVRAAREPFLSELKLRPPIKGPAEGSASLIAGAGGTRAGEWNQAMMELGATVCTPRAPRCAACPVARWCEARRLGIVEKIPFARKKRAQEKIEIAAAVLIDARGRTLLVKAKRGETNGLFSGMWQFPAAEVKGVASEKQKQKLLEPLMHADERGWGKKAEEKRKRGREERKVKRVNGEWMELEPVKHSVTYREITLRPYLMRVQELPGATGARVVALEKVEGMAVSSATKKIARSAVQECRFGFALMKRASLRNGPAVAGQR